VTFAPLLLAAGLTFAAQPLPIADVHFHVMPWMDVADLQKHMDAGGIEWAGGAGSVGGPAKGLEAAKSLGARYVRATGQGQWLSLKKQGGTPALEDASSRAWASRLASVEEDLRDNDARVIGEIHVNARTSAANAVVDFKIRADAPTLMALLDLAAKYKRPLNIHAQWDNDTAKQVAALADHNKNARLILSHCGVFASSGQMRAFLEAHANVDCDLSFRSPPQVRQARLAERAVFTANHLDDDWQKLIEDHPDRFVVGVDDTRDWAEYDEIVAHIRGGLLANLTPAAAEKVAHGNAEAWFGLK